MALVDDKACEGATQSPKRLERAGYPLPVIPNSRSRKMVEESYIGGRHISFILQGVAISVGNTYIPNSQLL
jgi:hypothetical protein